MRPPSRRPSTSRPCSASSSFRGNGQEFLDAAVAHANEKLVGTLGANVLIDPDDAGGARATGSSARSPTCATAPISINSWTAFAFLTPTLTWGGYPGGTLENVVSGIGVVHNALLLDGVERSVTRGPFRPFPRSIPRILRTRSLSKGSVLPEAAVVRGLPHRRDGQRGLHALPHGRQPRPARRHARAGVPRMSPSQRSRAAT